ncbi:DUF2690 domain-containing protein [Nonomuraea sediminis]|uniref:DUF2690 domain-containing protein n=1 Tax=Nonomuraea sediminis TaxID=2835864 RepID=UPI001BDCC689
MAAVLMTVLMSLGIVVAEAPPSMAAVGCTYAGCTGKDPSAMNCGSTSNADYQWVSGGSYRSYSWYLRYSGNCHAYWTRMVKGDCATIQNADYYMRIESELATPYGWYRSHVQSKKHVKGCDGTDWTRMIAWEANSRYRMCVATIWPPTSTDLVSTIADSDWSCWDWNYS